MVALAGLLAGTGQAGWQWVNPDTTAEDLHSVWGSSTGDIFAVGSQGCIIHGNGSGWTTMDSGTSERLLDVWGFAPDDVYVIGEEGSIFHWDGHAWQPMDTPVRVDLRDVWGAAPDDLYAVGGNYTGSDAGAVILHWNGSAWEESFRASDAKPFWSVHGLSGQEVFVTGGGGVSGNFAVFWDGDAWRDISTGLDCPIKGVWAAAPDDAWGVGCGEPTYYYHWDGIRWNAHTTIGDLFLWKVWGLSSDEVYSIASGRLVRWNGAFWDYAPHTLNGSVLGIGPVGDELYVSGVFGLVGRQEEGIWVPANSSGIRDNLYDVWVWSEDCAFAVGAWSVVLRWDGETWERMTLEPEVNGWVTGVWGTDPDNVYICGTDGSIYLWDGSGWTRVYFPTRDKYKRLQDLHGTGENDIWAVGGNERDPNGSVILRWDGAQWIDQQFHGAYGLYDVFAISSDNVYAVGSEGTSCHWDGMRWAAIPQHPDREVFFSVWASDEDHVFASGIDSMFLWEVDHWRRIASPGENTYTSIWGTGPDDAYAIGGSPTSFDYWVAHWDGFAWSLVQEGARGQALWGLHGSSADNMIAVGYDGAILRGDSSRPLGVHISLPAQVHLGETFGIRIYLNNPGPALEDVPVFFALKLSGERYYFWPDWQLFDPDTGEGLSFQVMDVPHGSTMVEVVPPFTWPIDTYYTSRYHVYGALTTPDLGTLVGQMGASSWIHTRLGRWVVCDPPGGSDEEVVLDSGNAMRSESGRRQPYWPM